MQRWIVAFALILAEPAVALALDPVAPPPPAPEATAPPPLEPAPKGKLELAPSDPRAVAPPVLMKPDGPIQPCAEPESVGELYAKARLERAIRLELDGELDKAATEARAGLEASPKGRYAAESQTLLERLSLAAPPSNVGARAELAVAATIEGVAAAGLVASAVKADDKGTVALLMLGSSAGLAGSLVATSRIHIDSSTPALFETGGIYAIGTVLILHDVTDSTDNSTGPLAVALVGGSLAFAGAGAGLELTPGDSGAAFAGMSTGAATGFMLGNITQNGVRDGGKVTEVLMLTAGTAGMVGSTIANRYLHWTRGRWTFVMLGYGVGALFGGGVAVLTNVNEDPGTTELVLVGSAVGTAATILATSGMNGESHGNETSLLERHRDGTWALDATPGALRLGTSTVSGKSVPTVGLSMLGGSF